MKLLLSALLLLTITTGCTVPGSKMERGQKQIILSEQKPSELDSQAYIYPISLETLSQLNKQKTISKPSYPVQTNSPQSHQYRIGSGDVLNIIAWYLPELNNSQANPNSKQVSPGVWVDEKGYLFFPLIGNTYVRGKTLPQVRQLLTQKLRRFFKNPKIDVNITEFRSQTVTVSGEVKTKGAVAITNRPLTLLDAVNQSGGATGLADLQHIIWTHKGQEYTVSLYDVLQKGKQSFNPLLSGGDIVHVPSIQDKQVYVMGEVGEQSTLSIGNEGLSLTAALGRVKGMNQNIADASGVFIIRYVPKQTEHQKDYRPISIYQLDLSDATAYVLGTQFNLEKNDVVYVTAAPASRWNRLLSQIFPSLSNIAMLKNSVK